ncbi:MAG: acyl carrier protein [Rothia sp. (in: high G+C Gram-positive bacteria)]|nr:acyl carrier protein [Rothia sp. (in: high G+C Gram-positive bacteria)]
MLDKAELRSILKVYIRESDSLERAFLEPDTDLFKLGLDSMGAFALLDDLADRGLDLEFTDLLAHPTLTFLREKIAEAGL